jgi:hypothetical protein
MAPCSNQPFSACSCVPQPSEEKMSNGLESETVGSTFDAKAMTNDFTDSDTLAVNSSEKPTHDVIIVGAGTFTWNTRPRKILSDE